MKRCSDLVVLFILWYSFALINCEISLNGVKCGDKICKRGEYCSQYHQTCDQCADICDNSHNFDESMCTKKCQDYIHDMRYMVKDGKGIGDDNLKATVQRLSTMITVTLTLVCFMLIALAGVFSLQIYRWKKKKNITLTSIKNKLFSKKSESQQTKPNITMNQTNGKPDLRIEMPAESTHSGNSPATVTTSISRRPAEDSTLDYAYDNPAMASSPNNKTSPNSFS